MNKILRKAPILFLISFSLLGCAPKEQRILKSVEKNSGIKYLTSAKILFYYTNITGFEDQSGPVYYVLDFSKSNKKEEFINTYFYKTGKNTEFEANVNEFVEQELVRVYSSFDSQYKLNFGTSYSYYQSKKLFMVYYPDTDISYFLYHLWIV